jgi:hypothetical protein
LKKKLKIKFVDFWSGFIPEENYFFDMLGGDECIELSEDPQILFFSNFGSEHKKYKCFRIFFSAENERLNMYKCDIALTFDYKRNKRHFRLPLFVLYLHHYKREATCLSQQISIHELPEWKARKFCCFVVSNGKSKERIKFYEYLCQNERVDSGGKYLNNIGDNIDNKLEFIQKYKFVISFENSSYPGYVTEKILEPFLTNSIPVYWGDPMVYKDFNRNSFINVINSSNYRDVYQRMKEIENSDELILQFLNSPKINQKQHYLEAEQVRDFIIQNFKKSTIPISSDIVFRIIAQFIDQFRFFKYWIRHYTTGNFR